MLSSGKLALEEDIMTIFYGEEIKEQRDPLHKVIAEKSGLDRGRWALMLLVFVAFKET